MKKCVTKNISSIYSGQVTPCRYRVLLGFHQSFRRSTSTSRSQSFLITSKTCAQATDMSGDVEMQDADAVREEQIQYGHGALTEEEMNEK
jgi:hypothetical protein